MVEPLLRLPVEKTWVRGRWVARPNRFVVHVVLDSGELVQAHCVNSGRMEGMLVPEAPVWLSRVPDEVPRKLRYTWELVELPEGLVGANTILPNALAERLVAARVLPGFRRFEELRREVPYGRSSRIDLWLRQGGREHYVEVKNCHLVYPDGRGYFPDSRSERATKHLEELMEVLAHGHRATVLFTVQRTDARAVRPSDLHDPAFASAARRAGEAGVRFRAIEISVTPEEIVFRRELPVDLRPYDLEPLRGAHEANWRFSGWGKPRA